MIDLSSLDQDQLKAANSREGIWLTIAGPGSGKTRSLTYRIACLVESGVKPDRILAITFSKNAAEEMSVRTAALLHMEVDNLKRWICTFHSLGAKIILMSQYALGFKLAETPIQPHSCRRILGEIVRDRSLLGGFELKYSEARQFISHRKREDKDWMETAWEVGKNDPLAIAYREYEQRKRLVGVIDYDDMIFTSWRLLRDNAELRARWQAKFSYVLVDEFHDTDRVQLQIVKTLAEPENNIFAVLDPSQAIYGWRGSDYRLAFDLEKDHEETNRVLLATNYRSVGPIVNLYKEVITGAPSVVDGFLEGIRHVREHPERPEPQFHKFVTDAQEARWLVEHVKGEREAGRKEAAVLYRTNRQSAIVEQVLFSQGIPYVIQGNTSFFSRPEVRAVMDFLRIVENKRDNEAMKSIILGRCECSKYLGKVFINDLATEAGSGGNECLYDQLLRAPGKRWQRDKADSLYWFLSELTVHCEGKPLSQQVDIIVKETGVVEALTEGEDLEDVDNLVAENVKELAKAAAQFKGTRKAFIDYSQNIAARAGNRSVLNDEPVRMMSIHRAKGLEFQTVYLIGANQGILPHTMGDPEEERRLAYVAVSRAKDFLHISTWERPSEFFERWFDNGSDTGSGETVRDDREAEGRTSKTEAEASPV